MSRLKKKDESDIEYSEEESITSGSEYNPSCESHMSDNSLSNSDLDLSDEPENSLLNPIKKIATNTSCDIANEKNDCSINKSGTKDVSFINSSLDVSINVKGVGEVMKNKHNLLVEPSKTGVKKNVCLYCLQKKNKEKDPRRKVHYANLVDHYETAHSEEKLIRKLNGIKKVPTVKGKPRPKQQIERLKILDYLRNKANYINNIHADDVSQYVVARRPRRLGNTVANYGTCFKCYKQLSLKSIHKHARKCVGMSFSNKRVVKSSSRAVMGDYHESASEEAIKIISKMRDDDVLEEIRYDEVVFIWLNAEASKYQKAEHNHDKIRAGLRRLGRILREMKILNEDVNELSDVFHEDNYDQFIECVKILGKLDPVTKQMGAPATASDTFHLIKSVTSIYDVMLGEKNKTKRLEVQAFEKKLIRLWHSSIGNTIAEQQAENQRNKEVTLPEQEDILRLRQYLEKNIPIAYTHLKKKYTDVNYTNLRDMIGCYLQVINCRRAGEVQRFQISEFKKTKIEGNECRAEVRGKRTKPVPVVFKKKLHQILLFLIANRHKAKISDKNPYVFANIHDLNTEFSCVKLCSIMATYAELCGANNPAALRGTGYRKQVATDRANKGIDNRGLEDLSSFLGHTPKIHLQNYRQSIFQRDIAVSKLVQESQTAQSKLQTPSQISVALKTNGLDNNSQVKAAASESPTHNSSSVSLKANSLDSESNEKESLSNEQVSSDHESNCSESSEDLGYSEDYHDNKDDKRNNSVKIQRVKKQGPAKTSERLPWKQKQINCLMARFPNCLKLDQKVPSSKEINKFLAETKDEILRKRKEPQIRSWIHFQRKSSNQGNKISQRNSIPNFIYSAFESYIEVGKIPSNKRCGKFMAKSPSKANITIDNIQTWVRQAIKRRKKKLTE